MALSKDPGPRSRGALEAAVKKHGFRDFVEFGAVAEAIAKALAGMDPDTKKFVDPSATVRGEIARVQADASIDAETKKQTIAAMNEALKAMPPLESRENIELVTRYYDRLVAVME